MPVSRKHSLTQWVFSHKNSQEGKTDMRRQRFIQLALALLMFMMPMALPVSAQDLNTRPRQIVLTWQHDPQTTMTVTWRTDQKGEKSGVYFTSDGNALIDNYQYHEAQTTSFKESAAFIHSAELTALNPGQTYWVVVETDGQKGSKFSFKTAPSKSGDVVFVMGADAQHLQTQMKVIREVLRKAAGDNPDFFVYSGDFVNAELSEYEWDLFFDMWDELMITADGRRIPLIPAMGNHEVVAGFGGSKETAPYYYNRFKLPEPQNYYSVQYGPDLTIISLDSSHSSPIDGAQTAWLEKTLGEHQDSPWIIAHSHVGTWWGPSTAEVKIRSYWVPLFEKYGVDVVHAGHSHDYARTVPIYGLKDAVSEVDAMIDEGLARAKTDFVPGKNYAPPLQKNLLQLSRGNWKATGFNSLTDGFREMVYMLSLFVMQTGPATKERVFDQISSTQLYADYWKPLLVAESRDDLVNKEKGVTYLIGGGLGAEMGGTEGDPAALWWLEETNAVYHYRRVMLDSAQKRLTIQPVFYYAENGKWEEKDAVTIAR